MASFHCHPPVKLYLFLGCATQMLLYVCIAAEDSNSHPKSSSIVFSNPKLLSDKKEDQVTYEEIPDDPDARKFGGIKIQSESSILASKLRTLTNKQLGIPLMQSVYDSLTYLEVQPDYKAKLQQTVSEIEKKLNSYITVLKTNKITVENLYRMHRRFPITHAYDCCSMPKSDLSYDSQYGCDITRDTTCDLIPQSVPAGAFNPGRNLTEVFQHIFISSIKWQYFISADGIHNEFPAHNFGANLQYSDCKHRHNHRHRMAYISTVYPRRKNVVIVIDNGNSLSDTQLATAKSIAKYIVDSLTERDMVGIMGLSSDVEFPVDSGCLSSQLSPLTLESKLYLGKFISNLIQHPVPSNHSLGFTKAFEMLRNTFDMEGKKPGDEDAVILYISRGLLSSLTEAKEVLNTIAVENAKMHNKVLINTYAVIDDGKPIMWEKSFLTDVARQDFGKYLVEPRFQTAPRPGHMVAINTTRDFSVNVANFSEVFNWTGAWPPRKPQISAPVRDDVDGSTGLLVSVTWPCFTANTLIGLVGLDVHLGSIMEDVTYYVDNSAYMFAVDREGYTLMHPSLGRPVMTKIQPMHTDISHFENYAQFDTVRRQILRKKEDSATIEVPDTVDNSSTQTTDIFSQRVMRITYRWKRVTVKEVSESPIIVVVKITEDGFKTRDLDKVKAPGRSEDIYHRLDLLSTDNMCMHLKQLATTDTSALFLASSAFEQPFDHLTHEENKRMVQGYLAYLNDNTGLISNPGLKANIKDDVSATSRTKSHWLDESRAGIGNINQYLVRRYLATSSGVLRMYPGTLLHHTYDPTRQEWFRRALDYPGKLALTAPYLDIGGAGYIVTLSHTVYQGKEGLHGPHDKIEAVMGIDLTLGYFYKLIIEQLPVCENDNIRCFIMDDRGYLIAHQGLIEPNGHGPQEQEHITRKEPLVANDILHHRNLVQKKLCNSYTDRTIQRFYQFNSSLSSVLTNLIHGQQFSRYQVTAIPGTNAFLGMVNETVNVMFCPCSMVDRLCLNCKRMEQTECECPCECPLELDFCTGRLVNDEHDTNPSCSLPSDAERQPDRVSIDPEAATKLPQCFHSHCEKRETKSDCLGVVDCEWCEYDHDGIKPLDAKFCGTQRRCFAGVLGAKTPYDDAQSPKGQSAEDSTIIKSTPVGPVAGGIMGCFLVLALGVYCYRHHAHHNAHHYISSSPDNTLRMSGAGENEVEDFDSPDEHGAAGHTNIVLASFENPASISPYRVNTNYRRTTNAESDLGYSTMTPHDDSEQASTCIEPLILGRDRYRPPSQASVVKQLSAKPMIPPPPSSRRSPSPPPLGTTQLPTTATTRLPPDGAGTEAPEGMTLLPVRADPSQTIIPGSDSPHRVIANVQVHMVDTH